MKQNINVFWTRSSPNVHNTNPQSNQTSHNSNKTKPNNPNTSTITNLKIKPPNQIKNHHQLQTAHQQHEPRIFRKPPLDTTLNVLPATNNNFAIAIMRIVWIIQRLFIVPLFVRHISENCTPYLRCVTFAVCTARQTSVSIMFYVFVFMTY